MKAQAASLYTGEQPERSAYIAPVAKAFAEQPKIEASQGFNELKELTQTLADLPLPVVSIIGGSGDELEGFSVLRRVKQKSLIADPFTVALAGCGGALEEFKALKKTKSAKESVRMFALSYSERLNFANPFVEEADAVLDRIDRISSATSDYDEAETPPDDHTKVTARRFILNVPGNLLEGADVFPYFGEVDITWQTGDKRVKLIVPPASTGASPSVYQGQMQQGRVAQPTLKRNATPRDLISSLRWLQS